jgi:hypothetical protein
MKWVLLNWLLHCFAALPLLDSHGLAATNEVGDIEYAASLRRCATAALPLLASNG